MGVWGMGGMMGVCRIKLKNKYIAFPDLFKIQIHCNFDSNMIQIYALYNFTTHWRKPGLCCASPGCLHLFDQQLHCTVYRLS